MLDLAYTIFVVVGLLVTAGLYFYIQNRRSK